MKVHETTVFLMVLLPLAPLASAAEAPEDTLLVVGHTACTGAVCDTIGTGYFEDVFDTGGLAVVRKGFVLGGDVYADGFKRGDLTVSIDGERLGNACPNRMDAPTGRLNPLSIASVRITRDGSALQSGLGGEVAFRRARPAEVPVLRAYATGGLDASAEMDAGLALETDGLRVAARHWRAGAYVDGDGRSFADLYGFAEEVTAHHTEVSVHQARDDWTVHGAYAVSREIMHPYLLMDERESDHWNMSFGRGDWKLHVDHTDHLMDNGLRSSGAATDMVTDASNTDIGLSGAWFDLSIRNWDADNHITPLANPAGGTVNHLMPDVWRWGATLRRETAGPWGAWVYGRLGFVLSRAGDDAALDLNRRLHAGAERNQASVPFALGLHRDAALGGGLDGGLLAEVVADAPGLEALYIGVDKPGTKPTWIGNPELDDPRRGTLRGTLSRGPLRLAAFASRVLDYPYLEKRSVGPDKFQTYRGADVWLAGASLSARWPHLDVDLDWQWGEREEGVALGEIPPLQLVVAARTPVWKHWRGSAIWTHAAEQSRIDAALDETATPGWDRLDLSLRLEAEDAVLEIALENLTDELYAEHLAYWRQVFGAGTRVNAQGRTVRVGTTFSL